MILVAVTIFMVMLLVPLVQSNAEADDATITVSSTQPEDILTRPPEEGGYDFGYLATVAGATAAVILIVQYTKTLVDKVAQFPTRLYVYILAVIVLLIAKMFGTGLAINDVPLIFLNATIVATSAMGTYEVTYAKAEKK